MSVLAIARRYRNQQKASKKKNKDVVELTEDSIIGSEWEKG